MFLARGVPFVFIDGGANLGFWSVLASSELLGKHAAIAIEPAPDTFLILEQNCKQNSDRYQLVNKALHEDSSGYLFFDMESEHASRRVLKSESSVHKVIKVPSVHINELCVDLGERPLLIKLDVEGQEISALKGAKNILMSRDVAVLYEDHGSDRSSRVTAWLRDNYPDYKIFFIHKNRPAVEVRDVRELTLRKVRKSVGYNLLMIRPNSVWVPVVEKLGNERLPILNQKIAGSATVDSLG